MIPRLLIAGAFIAEVDLIDSKLSGHRIRLPASGGENPRLPNPSHMEIEVVQVGVGNIEAALKLQRRLLDAELPPVGEIIFLGSAGVYPASPLVNEWKQPAEIAGVLTPGSAGVARNFHNLEWAVITGEASVPDLMQKYVEGHPGPVGHMLSSLIEPLYGDVNSPDSITLSARTGEMSNRYGFFPDFENMEAFGLALCARVAGVPFCPFFSLTNIVGPDGSNSWKKNYRIGSLQLQTRIYEILEKLKI